MSEVDADSLMKRIDQFHAEIVAFAEKTTQNVETLRQATDVVNSQKDTPWTKTRPFIPLALVLLVFVSLLLMRPLGVCQFSITTDKGFSVDSCESITLKNEQLKKEQSPVE